MRVITTHHNADFDGLAAMIAAHKLYPDAVLVFSGSQERNVREFTSQSLLYNYDFHKVKDIDLAAVDMASPENVHIQALSHVTLTQPGEAPMKGMGVFEQLIAGPYRPYGV